MPAAPRRCPARAAASPYRLRCAAIDARAPLIAYDQQHDHPLVGACIGGSCLTFWQVRPASGGQRPGRRGPHHPCCNCRTLPPYSRPVGRFGHWDVQDLRQRRGPRTNRGPIQGRGKGGLSSEALLTDRSRPDAGGSAMSLRMRDDAEHDATPGRAAPGGSKGGSMDEVTRGRVCGRRSFRARMAAGAPPEPNPKEFTAKTDLRDVRLRVRFPYQILLRHAGLRPERDMMKANPGGWCLIEAPASARTTDLHIALQRAPGSRVVELPRLPSVRANRISSDQLRP